MRFIKVNTKVKEVSLRNTFDPLARSSTRNRQKVGPHLGQVQLQQRLGGEAAALQLHAHGAVVRLRVRRDPHAPAGHQLPAVRRLRLQNWMHD